MKSLLMKSLLIKNLDIKRVLLRCGTILNKLFFYEQAFRPVPQENSLFVEQAGKPVLENGARCEVLPTIATRRGGFHPQ